MEMPLGLRSQTPISHTASKPNSAMASQTSGGTEPRSTEVPDFRLSSDIQTQVLISNTLGYRGQPGIVIIPRSLPASRSGIDVICVTLRWYGQPRLLALPSGYDPECVSARPVSLITFRAMGVVLFWVDTGLQRARNWSGMQTVT